MNSVLLYFPQLFISLINVYKMSHRDFFQVQKLASEHSIYCMKDGRMTLASLKTADDITTLGRAIHTVTR